MLPLRTFVGTNLVAIFALELLAHGTKVAVPALKFPAMLRPLCNSPFPELTSFAEVYGLSVPNRVATGLDLARNVRRSGRSTSIAYPFHPPEWLRHR